jgi:anthranilate phosphoribosyltransferase
MFQLVAEVLASRGCEGFVFRGDEGLDEISIAGPTTILQIDSGKIRRFTLDPRELGMELTPIDSIAGESAAANAQVVQDVFAGANGPARDALTLNAAAAIAAFKADFSLGIEQQFANALVLARGAIDSGKAATLVQRWAELSKELANSSL